MGEITNVVALFRKLHDNYPIVRIVETRRMIWPQLLGQYIVKLCTII